MIFSVPTFDNSDIELTSNTSSDRVISSRWNLFSREKYAPSSNNLRYPASKRLSNTEPKEFFVTHHTRCILHTPKLISSGRWIYIKRVITRYWKINRAQLKSKLFVGSINELPIVVSSVTCLLTIGADPTGSLINDCISVCVLTFERYRIVSASILGFDNLHSALAKLSLFFALLLMGGREYRVTSSTRVGKN